MNGYRDELAAAKHHVDTLEEDLRATRAALHQHELELADSRAHAERDARAVASTELRAKLRRWQFTCGLVAFTCVLAGAWALLEIQQASAADGRVALAANSLAATELALNDALTRAAEPCARCKSCKPEAEAIEACCAALQQNAKRAPPEQKGALTLASNACLSIAEDPPANARRLLQPLFHGMTAPAACVPRP